MAHDFNKKLRKLKDNKVRAGKSDTRHEQEFDEDAAIELAKEFYSNLNKLSKLNTDITDDEIMTKAIHYFLKIQEYDSKIPEMTKPEAYNALKELNDECKELIDSVK